MRYVTSRNSLFFPFSFVLVNLLTTSCLTNGNLSWSPVSTSYHLAFLTYNTPTTVVMDSSGRPNLSSVQVAIQNNASQTVTTSDSYTVALALYSDSSCTTAANLVGATTNSVGAARATTQGVATISLTDGSEHGEPTYNVPYYIKATAPGLTSACSSSLTFTASPVNLVVPIEMLDTGAFVNAAATTSYTRSQTSLDTSAYDGTVSYYFEIVADIAGGSGTGTVILENNSGTTFASISVSAPSSTTRYRSVAFTPTSGSNIYRVKLIGSTTGMLKVYAARIIVKQIGATKTKIYIPLLNGSYNTPQNLDTAAASTMSGSNINYSASQMPAAQTIWEKTSGGFATLSSTNPWTLEVVWMVTPGATVYAGLYDIDAVGFATATEMSSSDSSSTNILQTQSFSDSALPEGHRFAFVSKTGTAVSHAVFRAGIWATLSDLSKAEIYNRYSTSYSTINGTVQTEFQRILLDESLYTNPSLYLDTTAWVSGSSSTLDLADCGVNETGTGCTAVGTGSTTINAITANHYRGSNSFHITNGNRYIFYFVATPATGQMTTSSVVVKIRR